MQHVRQAPHVKAVYDLTIAYRYGAKFQEAPAFWDTLSVPGLSDPRRMKGGRAFRFEVHARRFAMEDLPREDGELTRWIEDRWVEKGLWLEAKRREWEAEDGVVNGKGE